MLRFVDLQGRPTDSYHIIKTVRIRANGFSSVDGRILMMMPHPERNFRGACFHGNLRVGVVLVTLLLGLSLKMFTNGLRINDFNSKFVRSVRRKTII